MSETQTVVVIIIHWCFCQSWSSYDKVVLTAVCTAIGTQLAYVITLLLISFLNIPKF